ncbi:MAG TPA: hypothetical protein VIT92_00205, partial [Burkholderiaceae bacterium]
AMRHLLHELHEFGHMSAARLLCGGWGARDFNNVAAIPAGCQVTPMVDLTVGLAGPLVNYLGVWIGALLILNAKSAPRAAWGLALIFACLPFARLFTALIGGGDEMAIARSYIEHPALARAACIALVAAVLAFPLLTAWQALAGSGRRAWLFLGFLLLPMLLEGAVILWFCNSLLQLGVLSQTWAFGAPGLVIVVLALAAIVFAAMSTAIASLLRPARQLG